MKPVQILMDDELLAALDADSEVRRVGRSKVLRRLAERYLEQRRQAEIDARYAGGYGDGARVAEELDGWTEAGTWPDE